LKKINKKWMNNIYKYINIPNYFDYVLKKKLQ